MSCTVICVSGTCCATKATRFAISRWESASRSSPSTRQLPLAAVPVISLLLCLWGQLLAAKARLAGFRLADLGGEPPYNVSVTPAGACKQQGTAEGFYRLSRQPDVSYRWQIILTPLALAAASILAAVVCFGGEGQPVRPLWIWSADRKSVV